MAKEKAAEKPMRKKRRDMLSWWFIWGDERELYLKNGREYTPREGEGLDELVARVNLHERRLMVMPTTYEELDLKATRALQRDLVRYDNDASLRSRMTIHILKKRNKPLIEPAEARRAAAREALAKKQSENN